MRHYTKHFEDHPTPDFFNRLLNDAKYGDHIPSVFEIGSGIVSAMRLVTLVIGDSYLNDR